MRWARIDFNKKRAARTSRPDNHPNLIPAVRNFAPLGRASFAYGFFSQCEAAMDKASAGRDQLAYDDVLLQSIERIGRGCDRSACQHLDGVLEGGG